MKFSELVKTYHPKYAILVTVGHTQTYIGKNSLGLAELLPEQVDWLDSHAYYWPNWRGDTLCIDFHGSKKYDRIVWG